MKRSEYVSLLKELRDSFMGQLADLNRARPGTLKPKQLKDMEAGFQDGSRAAVLTLVEKGHLTIEDD